ncbi:polysaccharide biosynthesis tyrosine autokinase [Streptantibioticus ferralitis]|uniref:Uncharacterized protein n=1 Tax=Streptantibioticus ferralitis TaxID=236510 RepID=A0ABT5Z0T8_9ACTN|nr:polysaccharide biosynthesis tyrosine autokinase [Streptantibioticus ferralitis]MDF2257455.1 hypothetical protein [Streptantibioticus ferralitis]
MVRLAESDTVARATALEAHLTTNLVAGHVTANAQPDVQIVTLKATADTASRAATIANAMAHVLNAQLGHRQLGANAYLRAQQLDQATPTQQPVEPKPLLNAALGGTLGLFAGLGLVSLRRSRDDRLYSAADIESELGTLVLAGIPRISPWLSRRGVHEAHRRTDVGNSIRTAVATLAAVSPDSSCQRLLVTSVRNDDGKATLTALLALGLIEQHEHVTLVEGQLHHPALTHHFPEPHEHTLQEWLDAAIVPSPSALLSKPQLTVIPGERTDPQHSAALFRGDAFPRVLDHLAKHNDVVLMHAPPVLGSADFAALARHADAVVLVVRAGATRGREARRALRVLRLIGAHIAGVVITEAAGGEQWARRRPSPDLRSPDMASGRPATNTPRLPTSPPHPALEAVESMNNHSDSTISSGEGETPSRKNRKGPSHE